ncbi:histidinol-phosphate transaminase [Aestuariibacter halophilus]|uniref:Histidinol-phosphate aminotransferase n=1 Tax=Fluctibacter halophilus TaxID=226011 RepID=A0ABS8G6S3_9ALTE|nr:histidinol-phosphate transaminase [Aestuariibacter halophilus]MCC2616289.1 histidinol-phosphate transaminase [Aestuariibacter halophilus]
MTDSLQALVPDYVNALTPYESARRLFSGGQDWLNANESPFVHDYSLDCERLNRYPDCQPPQLLKAYAAYAGVDADQVLVSRGADEGIELLTRGFCQPGEDRVLICPPTYGMYAISAQTFNVSVETAPLKPDFSLDLDAMAAFVGKVKLVYVCSPNNPTGTRVSQQTLRAVLECFGTTALVVVDEAYIEFDRQGSASALMNDYPQLVILRTLSKAFGLAGLRCGFTLAQPGVIQTLLKVIAPYPISDPVAQIAQQALSADGLQRMQQDVSTLQAEQQRLKNALSDMQGITLLGGDKGNFLLFRVDNAASVMDALVSQGMLIRNQSKQPQLNNCLRVSIGTEAQNNRLLDMLNSVLAPQRKEV